MSCLFALNDIYLHLQLKQLTLHPVNTFSTKTNLSKYLFPFSLVYSLFFVMSYSNTNKFKLPQRKSMKEIVSCFQFNFIEDA